MRNFNESFLTTVYKSNITRFKMDEDPLQRRIYFLTFIDLLDMIFTVQRKLWISSRLSKIGGGDVIEYYAKKAIMNLFMQTLMYTADNWFLNSQKME